jgi:tetratricopeptide (TPR) repeat protein
VPSPSPPAPEDPRQPLPPVRAMAVGGAYTDCYGGDDPTAQGRRIEDALREYRKLLKSVPYHDERGMLKLGDLLLKGGDTNNAIVYYGMAAERYENQGAKLKAMAVYKQIATLLEGAHPFLVEQYKDLDAKMAELEAAIDDDTRAT